MTVVVGLSGGSVACALQARLAPSCCEGGPRGFVLHAEAGLAGSKRLEDGRLSLSSSRARPRSDITESRRSSRTIQEIGSAWPSGKS